MTRLLSVFKWLFGLGLIVGILVAIFAVVFFVRATKDLPSVETLSDYRPAIMSRVHAGDGKLISEFKKEARVFVPIETIPKKLQHAVVAAEDQRFYEHSGFDLRGFTRAMIANVGHVMNGRRLEGGSTITQQVAKNFKVGNARTVERKLRELVIARRIEKALSKDKILELYLNENYFGRGAYGVAAASLNYFGKPMKDLELADVAYLAVLPKGPANYQVGDPVKKERALTRRNYVLGRMLIDGYATESDVREAQSKDIVVVERFSGEEYLAAEYFVEEARKQIFDMYGEDELYEGGLSIRTTLDTRLQLAARKALRSGLQAFDMRRGYRGPLGKIDGFDDWKRKLSEFERPRDIVDWRVALVMKANDDFAELKFADDIVEGNADLADGELHVKDVKWAGNPLETGKKGPSPEKITDIVETGDIILVQVQKDQNTRYNLRQIPEVNGGLVAMDPHTGRVLALVGGYSFEQSQFNRATQAYRQPGSAFKPFVYAAALEDGYTPATQVLDAPFVIERQDLDQCRELEPEEGAEPVAQDDTPQLRRGSGKLFKVDDNGDIIEGEECEVFYKPANYNEGQFYGLKTLRFGLEKSKNAMTVRMANDIGMSGVKEFGEDLGIYDEVKSELAWALGAGETTALRLAVGYSELVNGGKKVTPTILDRVQDGNGQTIFVHGDKRCEACKVEEWNGQSPPELFDGREQVMDPITAYQVTYMLKGVVDNGTGRSISVLGRPLGGKTGTTNDYKDAWFMGFSPDLVAGVYVGYDTPKPLANEAGGRAAAPIFRDFMREALKNEPVVPFRIPEGITLSPVTRDTGEPSYIGAPNFILEAFRAGTEPKLGDIGSTIRVGSATDSFVGSGLDFGDDTLLDEEENTPDNSDEAPEKPLRENGEGEVDSTTEDSETNTDPDIVNASIPPASEVKKPVVEPVIEDELEDGLY